MARFRKKPVVIDAWLYAPGTRMFATGVDEAQAKRDDFVWVVENIAAAYPGSDLSALKYRGGEFKIITLEHKPGDEPLTVDDGDYVIRGLKGEFYPCKPDIFALSYDAV